MAKHTNLIGMGFKWATVIMRKPIADGFTVKDYSEMTQKAISEIPRDIVISEMLVETEITQHPDRTTHDLIMTNYWKEAR